MECVVVNLRALLDSIRKKQEIPVEEFRGSKEDCLDYIGRRLADRTTVVTASVYDRMVARRNKS